MLFKKAHNLFSSDALINIRFKKQKEELERIEAEERKREGSQKNNKKDNKIYVIKQLKES